MPHRPNPPCGASDFRFSAHSRTAYPPWLKHYLQKGEYMKRSDDFQERRAHLANLTDDQLEARFWELANKLVDPLLKMGYEYTSPAVERSVLLRMGFSSIEAKAIVDGCIEHNLIAHGAGNVIYRLAKAQNSEIRPAGLALADGKLWDEAEKLFDGGNN